MEQFIFQDNFTRKKITVENLRKIGVMNNSIKNIKAFGNNLENYP